MRGDRHAERLLDSGMAALAGGLLGAATEPLPLALGLAALTAARAAARLTGPRPAPDPLGQALTEPALGEGEQNLAVIDALTGLPNRRALERVLAQACVQAGRGGGSVGVLVFGIRDMELLRRRDGVETSREALRQTGRRLRATVAQAGLVGRWGGAEFLIVLPAMAPNALALVAERLRRSLESEPVEAPNGRRVALRYGVGWACSPHDGLTAAQLVARARVHAAAPAPSNLTLVS